MHANEFSVYSSQQNLTTKATNKFHNLVNFHHGQRKHNSIRACPLSRATIQSKTGSPKRSRSSKHGVDNQTSLLQERISATRHSAFESDGMAAHRIFKRYQITEGCANTKSWQSASTLTAWTTLDYLLTASSLRIAQCDSVT